MIQEIVTILILTIASGSCIPVGGLLASIEHIRPHWLEQEFRHFLIALGGGILIGAVGVVLVPEGISRMQDSLFAIPIFLAGGCLFFLIERALGLRRRESPQLMGMILDYLPEAVALGGMVAINSPVAPLLALLIGIQNLPEGFNAYRELVAHHQAGKKTLRIMAGLVVIGPAAGLAGYLFLSGYPAILGAIMLFAAGGIIYLVFQDVAPQARLRRHWGPPLGAVLGFSLALFSKMVVTS